FFLLLSTNYFLRSITSRSFSRIGTLNASILILLIYLFQMPSLAEGIYWYSGSAEYQAGIIFSFFYFGLLSDYFNDRPIINRSMHFSLSALCLIAAVGFSEVIMLLLVSFHILICGLLLKNEKKIQAEWKVFTILCFICAGVVFFSPGNVYRNSTYPDNHHIVRSLLYTFLQTFRFGLDWISNLPVLLSSLILVPLAAKYAGKISFFRKLQSVKPWMIFISLLWVLFVCIFPPYFITNILGQHRTVNVACFFFLFLWFIGIAAFTNRNSEKVKMLFIESKKFKLIAILLILFSIAATKNGYDVFLDVFYKKANRFDAEMNERNDILCNPNNIGKVIYLKPLGEKPRSLFVLDLTNDSANWINASQADYFGVKEIICEE
ncbi:MAG: DUF6056 family protein, partial [Bacteroidia bacterium]